MYDWVDEVDGVDGVDRMDREPLIPSMGMICVQQAAIIN